MCRGLLFTGMMVLLSVAVGCNRKVVPSVTTEVIDSVVIREVPRYIPITLPNDKVKASVVIECDSTTNKPKPLIIRRQSGRATIDLKLNSSGELTGIGECDSLHKLIEVRDREITRLRSEKRTDVQTQFVTRKIDRLCRWFTGVGLIAIVGITVYRIKKFLP